jgi:alpha-galactosidase
MTNFTRSVVSVALLSVALPAWNFEQNASAQKPISLGSANVDLQIQSKVLRIEFDRNLHSRIWTVFGEKPSLLAPFSASETITTTGTRGDFALSSSHREHVSDAFGEGERLFLSGRSGELRKDVTVTCYRDFPSIAVFDVAYTNEGKDRVPIRGWANHQYSIASGASSQHPAFWSYQSGSYEKRPNWVLPLKAGFKQENFLGMNASDYGGGTPILDVWRKDVGLAVGHLEPVPRLISLPISMPDANHVTLAVRSHRRQTLEPGETFHTLRTFVSVHQGDYFRTLIEYRRMMVRQGFQMASAPESAYGAI